MINLLRKLNPINIFAVFILVLLVYPPFDGQAGRKPISEKYKELPKVNTVIKTPVTLSKTLEQKIQRVDSLMTITYKRILTQQQSIKQITKNR